MCPISAIQPYTTYNKRPSFSAHLNSVRYIILDGHLAEEKNIIESVIKQFAKFLRQGNIQNKELRLALKEAIPEYNSFDGTQVVKYLKSRYLGREFNIIAGEPAYALKRIWEQSGVGIEQKKHQAGDVISNLFRGDSKSQIALVASTENVKGKTKYIFSNIYKTV